MQKNRWYRACLLLSFARIVNQLELWVQTFVTFSRFVIEKIIWASFTKHLSARIAPPPLSPCVVIAEKDALAETLFIRDSHCSVWRRKFDTRSPNSQSFPQWRHSWCSSSCVMKWALSSSASFLMLISDLKRMTRFIAQHRTSLTHSELDNTQVHDLSARTKSVERPSAPSTPSNHCTHIHTHSHAHTYQMYFNNTGG